MQSTVVHEGSASARTSYKLLEACKAVREAVPVC